MKNVSTKVYIERKLENIKDSRISELVNYYNRIIIEYECGRMSFEETIKKLQGEVNFDPKEFVTTMRNSLKEEYEDTSKK